MAEFLPFHGRVWVLLATVLLAAVVNLILEFTTQSKEDILLCFYYKQQRKTQDSVESGGDSSEETASTGSLPSGSGSDQGRVGVVDELTKDNNTVGQNPIFIMYQGRRPSTVSAYSTYSADSFDGLMPSLSGGGECLPVVHANGQNPLFMMHQGRRPSAVSTCSADSLDGVLPSISSTSDGPVVLTHYSRRSSTDSNGEPSLSDQALNSNSKENRYPPIAMTTFPYLDSRDQARALSPIREFENEEEHPPIIDSPRKVSIQRSDSYMEALNCTLTSLEKADSKINKS